MRNALRMTCALAALCLTLGGHAWAAICPTTGNTNTDCGYILTIGPGDVVTGAGVPNANPYDGNDDALVGVINHSGSVFSGPIHLSGTGNGGDIFGFDGDGICTFTHASYCSTAATGYEGPDNTFANYTADPSMGDVVFGNIAVGGTTYFSLEGSPASLMITPPSQTPEPGSFLLLGTGVLGAAAQLRSRFRKV